MYHLTCECGQTIPVTLRQAGNDVSCPACSKPFKVPKLGELRKFPQVISPSDQESASRSIGMGKRLAFAALCLLAGLGFFVGAFCLIKASTIEVESTMEEHIASDIERLHQTPPGQVTDLWREYMVYGLNDRRPFPYKRHADEKAAWTQRGVIGMSIAGVAIVAAVILARSGRKKRQRPAEAAPG